MNSLLKKIFGSKKGDLETKRSNKKKEVKDETKKIQSLFEKTGIVELRCNVPSKKDYIAVIKKDEFNGHLSIRFKQVANYLKDKLITWAEGDFCPLDMGFRLEENQHFLIIETYQKTLKIKKNDSLAFLFEQGEIIEFTISEKGYKIDKDDEGVLIESKIPIELSHIRAFDEHHINKWRYTPEDGSRKRTGIFSQELKKDFGEMASAYFKIIDQFLDEK